MKVYGFDSTDIVRGELRANWVDACDMHFPHEIEGRFDWEFCSTRFVEAQTKLIARMEEEGSDPDLIDTVRSLKASFIPVDD